MTLDVFPQVDAPTTAGTLPGDHPYVKTGNGPRALVVLPGFDDAMFSGTYPPFTGWALAPYFARYLGTHTVYLLSRPRGLPAGYDVDDAVSSHVDAVREIGDSTTEFDGSTARIDDPTAGTAESTTGVDMVGISMGGMIAQALAHREPDLIDRVVLANSAARLDPSARPTVRRFERYARERDWASIRAELARTMFSDGRAVAYPMLVQTVGRLFQPRPVEPADVTRSLEFILGFDYREHLAEIDRPTLVFGGERDPFFPPERMKETVEAIPNAELDVAPGAKHGAFHERKLGFDSTVSRFLERS